MTTGLKQEVVDTFIIEITLIQPIEKIVAGLHERIFRDCDAKWLHNKLDAFIMFAAETLNLKVMNYSNIKQVVQELFSDNIRLYPDMYNKSLEEATATAIEVAKGYFNNRDEAEINRDTENDITLSDYETWCVNELESYIEQKRCVMVYWK